MRRSSHNNAGSDKNSSKRASPNRSAPAAAAEPDDDSVPDLIRISDDDDTAHTVENARRDWRHTRRSRPERQPTTTAGNNSSGATGRNSHFNEIDGSDSPPPLLDDDDDFLEIAPVATRGSSYSRHGRSGRAREGSRDTDEAPHGSVVFMNMFGPRPTHYCHQCRRSVSIDPSSTAIECPECHGSFVEEINSSAFEMEQPHGHRHAPGENEGEDDDDDDADPRGMGNFANIISSLMGQPARSRRRGDASSNSRRSASVGGGGGGRHFIRIGATGPRGEPLGGENAPGMQMEINGEMDIAQFMQQVIGAMTGRGVGVGGIGNPFGGDYVWSNEGFDQVMTQLLEQLGTMGGVPPLNQDALDKIPTTTPPQKVLDANENCIICFEPYKPDDQCKKLPCEHLFHTECISKWLSMHGTCPICRDDLSKKFPSSGNTDGGSGSSETSNAGGGSGATPATTAGAAGSANPHSTAGASTSPSPFSNFQFQPFTSAVFVADNNGNFRAVRPPQPSTSAPSGGNAHQQPSGIRPPTNFSSSNNNTSQQPAGHDTAEGSPSNPLMRFAGGLMRSIRGAMTGDSHTQTANPTSNSDHDSSSATSSVNAPLLYPSLPTRSPATGFDVNMPLSTDSSAAAARSDDARRRAAEAAAARASGAVPSPSSADGAKETVRGEGSSFTVDAVDTQTGGKRHKPGDGPKSGNNGKKLQYDDLD